MNLQMINFMLAVSNALHKTRIPLNNPDFDEILNLAKIHSLLPIAYEGCLTDEKFKDYSDSSEFKDKVYKIVYYQAMRSTFFTDIYSRLTESGIKALVIKGLFCRCMYGELSDHRPSGDEDVLVPMEDFSKAKEILFENGYELRGENEIPENLSDVQEITFYNPKTKLSIELHVNLFNGRDELFIHSEDYFKNVFDDAATFEFNGQKFYTLEYTKNYLFLFLHLYKHFITYGVGVRQIIDLLLFKEKYDKEIDWNEVEKVIKSKSLWQFYEDLIAIGNEYLGFSFPNIQGSDNMEMLLEDIEKAGTFGTHSKSHIQSSNLIDSAMLSNKDKSSKISVIFPSYSRMKIAEPILYDKPWLLPFMWIKRLFKYFIKIFSKKKRKELKEATSVADARLTLFKNYGIKK